MARPATLLDIEPRLAQLGKARLAVEPADIVEAVESVMASIAGDRSGVNLRLYEDVESLADFIRSAKAEISVIRADEINTKFLPAATDELSAIVGATEQATNAIFEAVEAIEAASQGMAPEAGAQVADAITRIYEACGFQDITGQRISKIVKTLQDVEAKVADLLQAFGHDVAAAPKGSPARGAPPPDPAEREDKDLMHGPQLPGGAMNQADIDALLASFD